MLPTNLYKGIDNPIQMWFELSYAQYLTIPRSIMEAMPVKWQQDMAVLLSKLDETYKWRPKEGRYWVRLKDDNGRYVHDPLMEYRHPDQNLINSLKINKTDNQLEYCDFCDGVGWYEGGKTLKTTCEKCGGTGVITGSKFGIKPGDILHGTPFTSVPNDSSPVNTNEDLWEHVIECYHALGFSYLLKHFHPPKNKTTQPPPQEQDELWDEVGKIVMDGYEDSNQTEITKLLKSKFRIIKNQRHEH